jgi:peptidase MA superfamily protein
VTPGDPVASPPGRRRLLVATTLAAGLVVALAGVVWSRLDVGAGSSPYPSDSAFQPSSREQVTAALLHRQSQAVAARDRAAYLAGWAASPSSRRLAVSTYGNLRRLQIVTLDARIDEGTVNGAGWSWSAAVDVTWGLSDPDQESVTSALRYTFAERAGRAVVVDVEAMPSTREPIWLLPGLDVRRGVRTMVAATDRAEGARVARLLSQAVGAVGRVLPRWDGALVAYVPATTAEFDALIDAQPADYRGIAAVTTTVDGSTDASAPMAIVVNPTVFRGLGPVSAQVVVTHESTHAATDAAASSMPLWLAEGFADYVAIGSVDVPVSVAARAALRLVRLQGAPAALPADDAFAVGGARLEATYEQAWLATSLLAARYGQAKLVAFYRTVQAHPADADPAFESVFGISRSSFTARWRADLDRLAHAD